jgi:hypothetical protein
VSYQARTVEVTWLRPTIIAESIAHAYRSTRPARQPALVALPVQDIVDRRVARSYRVLMHSQQAPDLR